MQASTGQLEKNCTVFVKVRRSIARLKTILRTTDGTYETTGFSQVFATPLLHLVQSKQDGETIYLVVKRKVKHPIYGQFT